MQLNIPPKAQRSPEVKLEQVGSALRYKSQQQECDFHGTQGHHAQPSTEKTSQENSRDQEKGSERSLFPCSVSRTLRKELILG